MSLMFREPIILISTVYASLTVITCSYFISFESRTSHWASQSQDFSIIYAPKRPLDGGALLFPSSVSAVLLKASKTTV